MKRILSIILVCLLAIGSVAFWQRAQITAWYCTARLANAADDERALWAERVANLDAHASSWLLAHLRSADAKVCNNVEAALTLLARNCRGDEDRCAMILNYLRVRFSGFSAAGKTAALRFPVELLKNETGKPAAAVTLSAGKLLEVAGADAGSDPGAALRLALQLSERVPEGQWQEICHNIALRGLKDARPTNRVTAVHLALNPRFGADQALLGKIAPLLRDDDAGVRRAALVAVGMSKELAAEEELLPLLHDADFEVRRLCKVALRSRGLTDNDLRRAELISDDRANVRLEVFNHLHNDDGVDPGVWLQRLTQDSSPAVRAAAIRMAYAQRRGELRDRIQQMARDDASPTVRQLAEHYLSRLQR